MFKLKAKILWIPEPYKVRYSYNVNRKIQNILEQCLRQQIGDSNKKFWQMCSLKYMNECESYKDGINTSVNYAR